VHRSIEQVPEGVKFYVRQVVSFENSFEMTMDPGIPDRRLPLDTGKYPTHRFALQPIFLEQGIQFRQDRQGSIAPVFRPLMFALTVLHINSDCM
jgi:hypothetical protein